MNPLAALQTLCESLPGAWLVHQWGALVYKVGPKVFAILDMEGTSVSLKSTKERQEALCTDPAIVPAPYLGRGGWVMVTISDEETLTVALSLIEESYRLVVQGLPKKVREAL